MTGRPGPVERCKVFRGVHDEGESEEGRSEDGRGKGGVPGRAIRRPSDAPPSLSWSHCLLRRSSD